jgi:menaquinone-dependent protoporphyrinogen IX oxidase
MRALVVFESMFGNTRRVAEAVGAGLSGSFDVAVVEAGSAKPDVAGLDLIVVGGPTHAWGMSRPMTRTSARDQAARAGTKVVSEGVGVRDWLGALNESRGKVAAAAFDTAIRKSGWLPSGSAARGEAARLRGKGYRLIAKPEQFFVTGMNGPLVDGELDRAKAWGAALAVKVK